MIKVFKTFDEGLPYTRGKEASYAYIVADRSIQSIWFICEHHYFGLLEPKFGQPATEKLKYFYKK